MRLAICSAMTKKTQSFESQHLLHRSINGTPNSIHSQHNQLKKFSYHFCLPSKAAILMLLWTAVVGTIYYYVLAVATALIDTKSESPDISLSTNDFVAYSVLAFVTMFYPFSGLIADVYCGRLKTVRISLLLLLVFSLLVSIAEIIVYVSQLYSLDTFYGDRISHHKPEAVVTCTILVLAVVVYIIGLAGYQANFIQLGLDQLFEAPSRYLSLFILYTLWVFQLGLIPMAVATPLLLCMSNAVVKFIALLPVILLTILIVLQIMNRLSRKRHWFYIEPGHQNPYKSVFNVIKFAKKHKHPLRRSAFAYCDDYLPSRIDFAKQRFGGPFTTEQVENVKTFLRIVIVLLATGPLFVLEVPASPFIFPFFGLHTLQYHQKLGKDICTADVMMLGTGFF